MFIALAFVDCDSTLAIIVLCAALSLSAGKFAGHAQYRPRYKQACRTTGLRPRGNAVV